MVIQPLSTRLIKPNFCFDLSHRRSTTEIPLEIHAQAAAKQQNPTHDPISDKQANEAICNVVATGTALTAEPVVPVELNAPESEVFTYAR